MVSAWPELVSSSKQSVGEAESVRVIYKNQQPLATDCSPKQLVVAGARSVPRNTSHFWHTDCARRDLQRKRSSTATGLDPKRQQCRTEANSTWRCAVQRLLRNLYLEQRSLRHQRCPTVQTFFNISDICVFMDVFFPPWPCMESMEMIDRSRTPDGVL